MQIPQAPVVVLGCGPVGMTLALHLARCEINVTVVDVRSPGEPPSSVKCNHISARSMEIYRRLGVAAALREVGLPGDFPNDVAFQTAMMGHELSRIRIPCRDERYNSRNGPDTHWPTPEPPHRLNQIYMEPVLFEHMARSPFIRFIGRTKMTGFEQDVDGVTASLLNLDSGEHQALRSRYLVGCDGARSSVRRWIGARLQGTPDLMRVQSTFIRAPRLLNQLPHVPAWLTVALNPKRSGTVVAIDGRETWLVHNYLRPGEADTEAVDRDWAIRTILGVAPTFEYEVLAIQDWTGHRLVVDRARKGRAFLCGDAAHQWPPFSGYGMNAGIADATNLGWLLAASLKGWASESILDAYECERLPITEQVSHFAMDQALRSLKEQRQIPQNIGCDGTEAERLRAEIGRAAYQDNVQVFCCGGLNFGYFYDQSPIIVDDGAKAPYYTMGDFTESTVPGCRLPHRWIPTGQSIYDLIAHEGYTLLRSNHSLNVGSFLDTFRERGIPVRLVDLSGDDDQDRFDHGLVLVRTDQHVAWRGHGCPEDMDCIVRRLSGRADAYPSWTRKGRASVSSSRKVP